VYSQRIHDHEKDFMKFLINTLLKLKGLIAFLNPEEMGIMLKVKFLFHIQRHIQSNPQGSREWYKIYLKYILLYLNSTQASESHFTDARVFS